MLWWQFGPAGAFDPSSSHKALTYAQAQCNAWLAQGSNSLHVALVQVKGVAPAVLPEQQEELLAAAAPFQNAYLAASLQRLSDVVTAAFPGGNRSLPTPAELQKCIGWVMRRRCWGLLPCEITAESRTKISPGRLAATCSRSTFVKPKCSVQC